MRKSLSPLLALTLFISGLARADGGLSLDQALGEARLHSPQLTAARAQASQASWHRLEAASGNLPQLSASAGHYFDDKFQFLHLNLGAGPVTFPAIYPQTTVSLDAAWTVFDGLKTPLAVLAASSSKEAADRELRRAELVLDSDVRVKFFGALAAQLLADVASQNVKTLRDHLARTEELLKRGKATRFDTLRVETQLAEAVPEEVQAADEVTTSRRELAIAMGLESDERPLTGALPEPAIPPSAEKTIAAELEARDDVQALIARADAAHRAYLASIGSLIPRVTLAAQKQWYDNVDKSLSFSQPPYDTAYNVGVFLTWSLFDGGASIARMREAVAAREQAGAAAETARLKAPQDIDVWRRRLLYESGLYHARSRAIETAQESVRLAKLGYGAGTRTSTDVLDAELDLFRARAGLVRAQVDAVRARTNLELALGHHL